MDNSPRKTPYFSVITVVKNGGATIERTIKSVLAQTFKNFEFIVLDGESNDETLKILNYYKNEIDLLKSEKDSGIYDAMNKGIAIAQGNWIVIINSDDELNARALEIVYAHVSAGNVIDVVYGDLLSGPNMDVRIKSDHQYLPSRMISHPATMVNSRAYQRYGKFDSNLKVAADYEFLLRVYKAGGVFHRIDAILAKYHLGGFSSRNWRTSIKETLMIQYRYGFRNRRSTYLNYYFILLKTLIKGIINK